MIKNLIILSNLLSLLSKFTDFPPGFQNHFFPKKKIIFYPQTKVHLIKTQNKILNNKTQENIVPIDTLFISLYIVTLSSHRIRITTPNRKNL